MTRAPVILDAIELKAFHGLQPFPGLAWDFWKRAAEVRGLDYRSLLFAEGKTTGLAKGHRHHWCWPLDIKCKNKP